MCGFKYFGLQNYLIRSNNFRFLAAKSQRLKLCDQKHYPKHSSWKFLSFARSLYLITPYFKLLIGIFFGGRSKLNIIYRLKLQLSDQNLKLAMDPAQQFFELYTSVFVEQLLYRQLYNSNCSNDKLNLHKCKSIHPVQSINKSNYS